jgi:hypothetical protein
MAALVLSTMISAGAIGGFSPAAIASTTLPVEPA